MALWAHVAASVKPLPGRKIPVVKAQTMSMAQALLESLAPSQTKATTTAALKPLVPIERRLRQRVARGQIGIDGVLDLHGMRQDEAHRALIHFLQRKHHEGAMLVIVITGKGLSKSGESERGVLKRLVPHWLADAGLRRLIIGFEDAALNHGGTGALYVRIRRNREIS